MKNILYFKMRFCPHCMRADKWIQAVLEDHPEYRDIPIKTVDENEERALANEYDYYFVPAFYVGDEKVHEGVASREIIEKVFLEAYT